MVKEFWVVESTGKCYIDDYLYNLFLQYNGFYKRKSDDYNYEVVIKKDNQINVIHMFEVKLFVIKYLLDNNVNKFVFSIIDKRKYFNINVLITTYE
ncbi:hypothetical protein UFOVP622_57 [uncultured Caudovirales phage]|uniref:Uncharacterized protein n=1 Tax=uncultured Caudovirales phage TaxID=2100421 RepID=A0A6J5N7R9_9CAUD|nr:hypothetical protein UFOVP622_57 [uncultured Caudovirales phage]